MASDMPIWHPSLSKVLLQLVCTDCSASTGCTVMRILTKLVSFVYHIFFFLSAKFRDCIFFPSRGAIFNVPECICLLTHCNFSFQFMIVKIEITCTLYGQCSQYESKYESLFKRNKFYWHMELHAYKEKQLKR